MKPNFKDYSFLPDFNLLLNFGLLYQNNNAILAFSYNTDNFYVVFGIPHFNL